MKNSVSPWYLRLTLLTLLCTSTNTFADNHEDYMEQPDLESEAQLYEANTAPKVSFQELPYEEESTVQEIEAEYVNQDYETP